jgi:hypothetical protein
MTLSDHKALHAYNMRRKPRMTDERAIELSVREIAVAILIGILLWVLW